MRGYASGPRADGHRFLRNLLGIRMTIALGGLVLAVLFGLLVGYPSVMVVGTVIAGAGMVVLVAQDGCSVPLQVGLRFGWVAGLQLAIQVGIAIEAVLLALAGAGLLPFFALQLPVAIPALIVTMVVGGHDSRLVPSIDLGEWRKMVGRILPYSAAVVLSVVYFQIAQIMVSVLSSPSETGYFGVAFRVLVAFTVLPPLLVSTSLPLLARAARDDDDRFDYASRRLVETMLLAGCGVALGLYLGAAFAVPLIAGPGFGPSVDVVHILAFALLGSFVIGARGYGLLSLDRLRAMLVCNAIALTVVVVAGVPLIEAYGAEGAAIAMVAAELTLALCYEWSLSLGRPRVRLRPSFVARTRPRWCLRRLRARTRRRFARLRGDRLGHLLGGLVGTEAHPGGDPRGPAATSPYTRMSVFGEHPNATGPAHGQFDEDRLLADVFGDVSEGYCVEVGAYDGRTGSATFAFERCGWHCLLIEPIPALYEEIRKQRECLVVNCAASGNEGEARFYVAENVEQMSTLDLTSSHRRWIEQVGGGVKEITVRTATLDSLLADAAFPEIHFITIDVEGHEMAVLEGFTLERHKPRVVIIEDNTVGGNRGVARHMEEHGYVHFRRTGVNEWYARASDTALVKPDELKGFKRAKARQQWQRRRAHMSNRLATRVGSYLPTSVKQPLRRPLDYIRRSIMRK